MGGDREVSFKAGGRWDCTVGYGAEVGHDAEDAPGFLTLKGNGITVGILIDVFRWLRVTAVFWCLGGWLRYVAGGVETGTEGGRGGFPRQCKDFNRGRGCFGERRAGPLCADCCC